jgi:hypothetical protein
LLFPVDTVLIAARVTGETISGWFIAGGLIVLIGVWLGTIRQSKQPSVDPKKMKGTTTDFDIPPQPGCA